MSSPVPASGVDRPRQRLHPLTPLLRGLRFAALAVVAISWQGYEQLGTRNWALAVAVVAIVLLLGALVSWLVTGYEIAGRELRVYEGLVWRRTRAIPLERLQAVELVQPVLARLFGLAELRLEVVGAAKTEAPLAFLPLSEALTLRQDLLTLSRPVATAPDVASPHPVAPAAPAEAHVVANRDLLISQLLRPQWWALPIAIAAPIIYFLLDTNLGFVAFASTATAVIGAIQAPVRVLLGDWRFTIGMAPDGLRIRRGLLETRSQTIPPGRVQAVGVEWPLLWRGYGWVRARVDVAGVVAGNRERMREGTLLPVAPVPQARTVIGEVLPGFDLTSVAVLPTPRRARWLAPFEAGVLGYTLTPTAFVARGGLLTRHLVIVPYARIQSVRVVQRPSQRLLRLADVHVDTAAGGSLSGVARYRDVREVRALALELSARARQARTASPR